MTEDTLDQIVDSLDNRLNVYGCKRRCDHKASDIFSDDQFIVVEIAGASQSEVTNLLQSQGKFEAKIANQTVFSGDNEDITYVCRSADCSGIDPCRGVNNTKTVLCVDTHSQFHYQVKLHNVKQTSQIILTWWGPIKLLSFDP